MDSIGCQFIVDTVIADPDSIHLSASVVDVLLGGDGEIDLTITGGMPTYVIDWDNDGVGDFNDDEDLSGLIAGTYFVTVIDAYGCSNTLSVVVGTSTNLYEQNNQKFIVYPNPIESILYVKSSSNFSGKFVLIDALGRQVAESTDVSNQSLTRIEMNKLESGMYLIMLCKENEVIWSQKLVK